MKTPTRLALALMALLAVVAPAFAARTKKTAKSAAPTATQAAMPTATPAADPPTAVTAAQLPAGTEVKVERVRPEKENVATLRFLRENIDFIRAQYDRLREQPIEGHADASDIDPRFLLYQRLLAEALASRDTVGAAEDARSRQQLLQSIAQLGSLEEQLDAMERQLEKQRTRLANLEDDFTGHQETALMVVLSGYPRDLAVSEVTVTIDDAAPVRVALTPEQCQSLKQGGVVELFHGFAEPREQVIGVALGGVTIPGGDTGFVTLHPIRDRLTFLRFDLTTVQPAQGGASVRASTWLHEAGAHSVDG